MPEPAVQRATAPLQRITVSAYRVPTDTPDESDGTLVWSATTLVLVEATAAEVLVIMNASVRRSRSCNVETDAPRSGSTADIAGSMARMTRLGSEFVRTRTG